MVLKAGGMRRPAGLSSKRRATSRWTARWCIRVTWHRPRSAGRRGERSRSCSSTSLQPPGFRAGTSTIAAARGRPPSMCSTLGTGASGSRRL